MDILNVCKIERLSINGIDGSVEEVNKLLDAVKALHSEVQDLRAENKSLRDSMKKLSTSVNALNDYTGCGSQFYRSSKSLNLQIVEIDRRLEKFDRNFDYINRGLKIPY